MIDPLLCPRLPARKLPFRLITRWKHQPRSRLIPRWTRLGVDTSTGSNFNRYWYANNSPYRNVDPDGRQAFVALRLVLAGAALDAETPDPSDVAAPVKAAVYGGAVIGTALGGLIYSAVVAPILNSESVGPDSPHAPGDVPDDGVIVRGGQGDMPEPGTPFSGSQGGTVEEAAKGVPHGTITTATAGGIRANGGTVEVAPEPTRSGNVNGQHVNVTEGGDSSSFGPQLPNPVPKQDRIQ